MSSDADPGQPPAAQPPARQPPAAQPPAAQPPTAQLPGSNWFLSGASVIGASHVARGMPCQDAFLLVEPAASGDPAVVAVADGHGARRHFRSAAGARFAVEVAIRAALRHAAGLAAMTGSAEVRAAVRGELTPEIVRDWRIEVGRDVEDDPFSPEETASMAAGDDTREIPYGSTLLVGLVVGRWLVCVQIGDGDIVVVASDGQASIPVPGDPALDGLRTTSLCQADALRSFRDAVQDVTQDPVLAVLVVTDGYGNAQSDDPWHPRLGTDLADLLRQEGPEWVADRLPGWAALSASSEGSGDDTTIGLIVSRCDARSGSSTLGQARTVTGSP